jgi:hypothetical protein
MTAIRQGSPPDENMPEIRNHLPNVCDTSDSMILNECLRSPSNIIDTSRTARYHPAQVWEVADEIDSCAWDSACALLIVGSVADAFSQQFTGGIRGTIGDANGVIPGIAITVTNEGTNVSRETVTNEVGQHNFRRFPATYIADVLAGA